MASGKEMILNRVKEVALGNTRVGFKEVASDLLNAQGRDQIKNICQGTFLSRGTVERVMECEPEYRPQSDTLERIFRYCNAEVVFNETTIKAKFQNTPKHED
jgi:hypothetical protein